MLIFGAPVVHRLKQLLAVMLALEFGVNTQQRQHMHRISRHAGLHRLVIGQIAPRAAQTGAEHHAQLPGPALGNAQAPLRRRDQGNAQQPVIDQQAQRWQILQKMLLDQFAYRGPDPLLVAAALGVEQKTKRRLMAISLVQQRTRLS